MQWQWLFSPPLMISFLLVLYLLGHGVAVCCRTAFTGAAEKSWNYQWRQHEELLSARAEFSVVLFLQAGIPPSDCPAAQWELIPKVVWAENKNPLKFPSLKPLNPNDPLSWLKWGFPKCGPAKSLKGCFIFPHLSVWSAMWFPFCSCTGIIFFSQK